MPPLCSPLSRGFTTSHSVQEFGPEQPYHSKILWPAHLESTTCSLPTSFLPLLRHNLPLSTPEVTRVREYQSLVMDSLNQECLKEKPKEQSSSYHLEKQLFICDVVMSPFRRLPNDILYRIALHCPIYIGSEAPLLASPGVTHFPSILAQVCRAWREAVQQTSSSWAEIRMFPKEWNASDSTALQQQCALFGRLSGARPLSVHLQQTQLVDGLEIEVPFDDLCEHSGFIKALSWVWSVWYTDRRPIVELSLTMYRDSHDLFNVPNILQLGCAYRANGEEQGAALRSLKITGYNQQARKQFDAFDLGNTLIRLLHMFPNLRHFSFDNIGVANIYRILQDGTYGFPGDITSWASLTSLHISADLPVLDLRALLTVCPNLTSASLSVLTFDDEVVGDPSTTCVHNSLKELKLTLFLSHEFVVPATLAGIQFPNLHRLVVKIDTDPPGMALKDVEDMDPEAFTDVFPAIRTLEIANVCLDQGEMLIELYTPLLDGIGGVQFISVDLCGILDLPEILDFFNFFSFTRGKNLGAVQHLALEVSPDDRFVSISDERRDKITSSILANFGHRRKPATNDTEKDRDSDKDDDDGDDGDDDNSNNNDVIVYDSNAHTYAKTLRYRCGGDAQDADTPEHAYFMDLMRRSRSHRNAVNKIVIEC